MALLISPEKISLSFPLNRDLPFRDGEVVTGIVTTSQHSGLVSLNLKGVLVNAEATVPLTQGVPLLFRVSVGALPGKIVLQLVDLPNDAPRTNFSYPQQDIAGVASNDKKGIKLLVEALVTSGPLPVEVRRQLIDAVLVAVKSGGSVPQRLEEIAASLPEPLKAEVLRLKASLSFPFETGAPSLLAAALENSGVAMEAKVVRAIPIPHAGRTTRNAAHAADLVNPFSGDLKAELSQLQQSIRGDECLMPAVDKEKSLLQIDKILKQIELFQLLSIGTGTFSTFLPVVWEGLKKGNISVKHGVQHGEDVFTWKVALDLVEHGELVVLLLMRGDKIYLSLKPDNENLRDLLAATLGDFVSSCPKHGIKIAAANVLDLHHRLPDPLEYMEGFDDLLSVKV